MKISKINYNQKCKKKVSGNSVIFIQFPFKTKGKITTKLLQFLVNFLMQFLVNFFLHYFLEKNEIIIEYFDL